MFLTQVQTHAYQVNNDKRQQVATKPQVRKTNPYRLARTCSNLGHTKDFQNEYSKAAATAKRIYFTSSEQSEVYQNQAPTPEPASTDEIKSSTSPFDLEQLGTFHMDPNDITKPPRRGSGILERGTFQLRSLPTLTTSHENIPTPPRIDREGAWRLQNGME